MAIEVRVDHPEFPEGTPFGITDLGVVPNGGSLEVDEDMERAFVAARQTPFEEAFVDSDTVTVSGSSSLDSEETDKLTATEVSDTIVIRQVEEEDAPSDEEDATVVKEGGES